MEEIERIRREVWVRLQGVAFPDSRFHWDFTAFIPDFIGSEQCARRIRQMKAYTRAKAILATPDNNLASLRAGAVQDGKLVIVPTYAIGRGFWKLGREYVPEGQEDYATSLDGLEQFGQPYLLEEVETAERPALLITGASVLNTQGVRLSLGPSYFDLEWLILFSLGLLGRDTPILAAVHDCQVVDFPCEPLPYCVTVDTIVTPTRTIETGSPYQRPEQIAWTELPWHLVKDIPLARRLYEREVQQHKLQ